MEYLIYLVKLNITMKKRISATIDEKTEQIIKEILKKGIYRNKSHIIEDAIKSFKDKKK